MRAAGPACNGGPLPAAPRPAQNEEDERPAPSRREAMIRPTRPQDRADLLRITAGTGVFKPMEVEVLGEVLDDYHAEAHASGHRCVTYVHAGQVAGFAYYAPTVMTDNTWYLYWIVVSKEIQARGIGAALLRHAEEDIRGAGGRIFLIETSSLAHYDPTRRFYLKYGYDQEAVLRDFYADGDDMVVFRKRLAQ
jgi:ribosomal protein S18 acetylase RimI-like enzyme